MKRSFFVVGLVVALMLLFGVSATPANAQFTLLPQAPEGADCKALLDSFEVDGKIPSAKSIAQKAGDQASRDYTAYMNSLDPFGEEYQDCVGGSASGDKKCDELHKKSEDAQAAADSASEDDQRGELLGCAIRTGRISLQMVPYFITYMANFLLAMSGIVAVLFIVVGGYFYIYGGMVDQKERGKKYLVNALLGLSLATVSWALVTFIITAITSYSWLAREKEGLACGGRMCGSA